MVTLEKFRSNIERLINNNRGEVSTLSDSLNGV